MKNKANNSYYTVFGVNNCTEILNSDKDKIISIFLLKDGLAQRNDNIKKSLANHKDNIQQGATGSSS